MLPQFETIGDLFNGDCMSPQLIYNLIIVGDKNGTPMPLHLNL